MSKRTLSGNVVTEMLKTTQTIGNQKTIDALKTARNGAMGGQPHIEYVVSIVCTELSVSFEDVKNNVTNSVSDDMLYAKGFIVYYLRRKFETEWVVLKNLLDRDQSTLHKSKKLITDLNSNHSHDKPYCDHKKKLDDILKKYKP